MRGDNTTKILRNHEEIIKVPSQQKHLEFNMVAEHLAFNMVAEPQQQLDNIRINTGSIRQQDNWATTSEGGSTQLRTTPRWPLGRPPRGHNWATTSVQLQTVLAQRFASAQHAAMTRAVPVVVVVVVVRSSSRSSSSRNSNPQQQQQQNFPKATRGRRAAKAEGHRRHPSPPNQLHYHNNHQQQQQQHNAAVDPRKSTEGASQLGNDISSAVLAQLAQRPGGP